MNQEDDDFDFDSTIEVRGALMTFCAGKPLSRMRPHQTLEPSEDGGTLSFYHDVVLPTLWTSWIGVARYSPTGSIDSIRVVGSYEPMDSLGFRTSWTFEAVGPGTFVAHQTSYGGLESTFGGSLAFRVFIGEDGCSIDRIEPIDVAEGARP